MFSVLLAFFHYVLVFLLIVELGRSHLDASNSNGWAAAAARGGRTQTKADGSSLNKQWSEVELTLYHIPSAATWRRWHNDQKVWSGQRLALNTPGAREAEDDIQQLTHTPENNTQRLAEQIYRSNEGAQRYQQRHASPTSKYKLFEWHGRLYHAHDLRRWACCQTSRQECRG